MGQWPGEDHRHSPRLRTDGALKAQLSVEAEVLYLSAKGMMIRLDFAPEVGTRFAFSLSVGSEPLDVAGVVRNVEVQGDGGRAHQQVGIEFMDLTSAQTGVLEAFVARKLG